MKFCVFFQYVKGACAEGLPLTYLKKTNTIELRGARAPLPTKKCARTLARAPPTQHKKSARKGATERSDKKRSEATKSPRRKK